MLTSAAFALAEIDLCIQASWKVVGLFLLFLALLFLSASKAGRDLICSLASLLARAFVGRKAGERPPEHHPSLPRSRQQGTLTAPSSVSTPSNDKS